MEKILFVCSANVGRSQMAEVIYNTLSNSQIAYSAAGIEDVVEKYKHGLHPDVVSVMKEINFDVCNLRPKLLTEEMVQIATQVFVFCNLEQCPEYLIQSKKSQS